MINLPFQIQKEHRIPPYSTKCLTPLFLLYVNIKISVFSYYCGTKKVDSIKHSSTFGELLICVITCLVIT